MKKDPITIHYHGIYAVILSHNCLLTVRKERGPYTGMLDLPGGGVQAGERALETLTRELWEEVSLPLDSHRYIGEKIHKTTYEGRPFHHKATLYEVTTRESMAKNVQCMDVEEVSECVWLPIQNGIKTDMLTFIAQAGISYALQKKCEGF